MFSTLRGWMASLAPAGTASLETFTMTEIAPAR
jgi:hypothetical protein